MLQAAQPLLVPGLDQLVDQGRGGGEADRQPLLARRQAEPQREMGLASGARTRGILPNITTPMGGSFIGITLAMVRAWRS
jgi:hypothetical protein